LLPCLNEVALAKKALENVHYDDEIKSVRRFGWWRWAQQITSLENDMSGKSGASFLSTF
jgi:hypothetical protein